MPKPKKTSPKKTASSEKLPSTILVMDIVDVFVASSAKQRTYIEQLNFAPRNFTQKHLGTICGFFMVRDKSPWSAHIVHFLNAEFKKEYLSQSKRSLSDSFAAALHHTNRALAELAKNDNINWIGMLDSVLCAYDDTTIHFSVTGGGIVLLLRGDELIDISQGLAPNEATPNPLKTFIDTASGKLIGGDKLILTSSELLNLVPFDELEKNLIRFDDDEFFQFVSTVLTNECSMASTQIITVHEKKSTTSDRIPQSHGIISNIDLPAQRKQPLEDDEIIIPENAFSAKQYRTHTKKEQHYIPDTSKDEKTSAPAAAKKNPLVQQNNETSSSAKRTASKEYVDKRTGHIYVSGDSPETSSSALAPYLDTGKDIFTDSVYNIKKWSRSLIQKSTYFFSQASIFIVSCAHKAKGFINKKLHSAHSTSIDEIIEDIPSGSTTQKAMDSTASKDSHEVTAPKSSDITFSSPIFSKKSFGAFVAYVKALVRQWNFRAKTDIVFRRMREWSQATRSTVQSLRRTPSMEKREHTIGEEIVFTQDSEQVPEVITRKKPVLWKKQEVVVPKATLSDDRNLTKQPASSAKAQISQVTRRSTPQPIPDDHFSVLNDLYKNEDFHFAGKTPEESSTGFGKFLETQTKRLQHFWKRLRNLVPHTQTQEKTTPEESHSLVDIDRAKKIDDLISGNRVVAKVERFFPGFMQKVGALLGYIRAWKVGNTVIKIVIGIVFVSLIVYPLYNKITAEKAQEEASIAEEERIFEENLSETVQEELTVPEPTKTVPDPVTVSTQSDASQSILFEDTLFVATQNSLLAFTSGNPTTIPLPEDAGNITHMTPMTDVNLIFFLTDTNILYAYNPSTDIFNRQSITTPLDYTEVIALRSYQQKFYVATDGGITRFDRAVGGFDNDTSWIIDGTSIRGLSSLTIDGNVFVAKDGKILIFSAGSILDISSPENIQADFVYKTQDMENLWVLDTANFSIYKLDSETLAIIESFVHEDLRDSMSFSVDEDANTAYIMQQNGTTLSLSLVNTQQGN